MRTKTFGKMGSLQNIISLCNGMVRLHKQSQVQKGSPTLVVTMPVQAV